MKKTQSRHMKKRILSAALAMGMVLTMLPSDGIEAAAKRVVSNAAKGDVTYEYNNYTNTKTVTRVRKAVKSNSVADAISDSRAAKGSIDNPYLILEVVPQKDYSSIGYLVDGCEPINMDSLCGNKLVIDTLTGADGDFFGFGKFTIPDGEVVFFPDEEEGDIGFYQNTNLTADTVTIDGVDIDSHQSALKFTNDQWDAKKKTDEKKVYGYYEVVPKGEGKFVINTVTTTDIEGNETTTRSIVKADSTNQSEATLVWHTTNPYMVNQYRSEGVNTSIMYLALENLNTDKFPLLKIDQESHVGNRFYTLRIGGDSDPYYDVTGDFYVFKSNDLFAKNTLGLSDAEAKKCSIAVKTITPYELNKNYEDTADKNKTWVGLADVIYFNADLTAYKEVTGSDTDGKDDNEAGLIDLWQSTEAVSKNYMNRFHYGNMLDGDGNTDPVKGFKGTYDFDHFPRLGPSANNPLRDEENYLNKSREISLDVFYAILDRVSRSKNYVAVIFDQTVTKPEYNETASGKTYYLYKLGDTKAERSRISNSGYGSTGYMTNVAKLWLACTSANPGLVKRFMIDDGAASNHDQITKGTGRNSENIIFAENSRTNMTDDEKKYWSGYTFYCADKKFNDATDGETYWKNYAGDAEHKDDCYFVQAHVFVTPDGVNLVEDYVKPYSNSNLAFAATKYKDFNEFLADFGGTASNKANVASSSLATKYVLDPDKIVNYYLDELTVLDVEPSVGMRSGNNKGDRAYDWKLSDQDIIKMIPKRMGSETRVKSIVHQVMPAFIAKNEDLNSTYDLIYLGADASGFWTGTEVKNEYYKNDNNYIRNNAKAGENRTDFVDNNMDGLVYFQVGDTLKIQSSGTKAYNYQLDAAAFGESNYSRQSGNDLTTKKKAKLVDYLNADYPIVIADNLYPSNWGTSVRPYVQTSAGCVMYQFLREYDPEGAGHHDTATDTYSNCYYTKDMLEQIDKMISNRMKGRVTIGSTDPADLPVIYDTNSRGNIYLDDNGTGYARLHFKVTVPNTTDYLYRVFVDRNRDSNFTADAGDDEKNEVITNGYKPLTRLVNELDVPMPDKWVGFVQWRIEVVHKDNYSKRYSKEGCSAVAADPRAPEGSDRAKKKIVALQIMPTHTSRGNDHEPSNSWVDLSNRNWDGSVKNNGTWSGLYSLVTDFDIEVVAITWRQFNQLFKPGAAPNNERFVFHMGSPINISNDAAGNPKKSVIERVEQTPINFYTRDEGGHKKDEVKAVTGAAAENYYKLDDFNMIVLGFDDAYGLTDMSNEYGCVEYLYYFTQKGCSILFTHDTTSQHSSKEKNAYQLGWVTLSNHQNDWHEYRPFGYTGNNMMREIMGMNRYMQYSKNIGTSRDTQAQVNFRSDLLTDIQAYVSSSHIKYDGNTAGVDGLHGFSMFNLLRYVGAGANDGKNGRVQYKYMVKNPNGGGAFANGGTYDIEGSPYNNVTEVVSMINEGQITQYPFTIGDGAGEGRQKQFKIGQTHGQWWQLNMEDEDLTVWYTLDDPATSSLFTNNTYYDNRKSRNGYNDLIYSAVPFDAANNFYIFSKGNIFYSGVGHSALEESDPNQYERKLFVNTLVAAYRPKFGLPFIQVTSTESSLISNSPRLYGITLPMDYEYGSDDKIDWDHSKILVGSSSSELVHDDDLIVRFKAMDNNGCSTIYTCVRYADSAGGALPVYSSLANARNRSPMSTSRHVMIDDSHAEDYYELVVGQEYYIRFPQTHLKDWNKVLFRSYNNRVTTLERDETFLQFSTQPLFKLD